MLWTSRDPPTRGRQVDCQRGPRAAPSVRRAAFAKASRGGVQTIATDSAVRRFPKRDRALARKVLGLRPPASLERLTRRLVALPARKADVARIHFRGLPAPAALGTEPAVIDDPLMAAVVRARAEQPRWEAAWRLVGDVRVTSGHPLVFANGRLMPESAAFDDDGDPVWRHYARQVARRPVLDVERAVLCREAWDSNYWHLLDGVLPRFVMADALGIDPAIPAIVSSTFVAEHGRRLAGTAFPTERPLIVQHPGLTVRCRELYLLRPAAIPSDLMPGVLARIPDVVLEDPAPRRIYVRRAPKSGIGRTAENTAEVDGIFREAGFSIIDPTDMALAQQKAIFSGAEIIAGINGAAFANGLFRQGRGLTIGSLISANWMSTVFPTMARVHGFRFVGHVVQPAGDDISAAMLVPPDTVRRLIDRIV